MKLAMTVLLFGVSASFAAGQAKPTPAPSEVQLELTDEVAATTREGYPAALRITLKNSGYVAVDLPMPGLGCDGSDGTLKMGHVWYSSDSSHATASSGGCGGALTDRPALLTRARDGWIHLQPGEFLTVTQNVRGVFLGLKPGFMDYWVEYEPPQLTTNELQQLRQAGYTPPTKKLKTVKATVRVQ